MCCVPDLRCQPWLVVPVHKFEGGGPAQSDVKTTHHPVSTVARLNNRFPASRIKKFCHFWEKLKKC